MAGALVARGLDKQVVRSLMNDSDWVRRHQHIFLVGPTGIGKTFLAKAFGQKACRDGFSAYFATAAQLFRELELARADGSYAIDHPVAGGEVACADRRSHDGGQHSREGILLVPPNQEMQKKS